MSSGKKTKDPFFEVIPDAQWNACVGIQGDESNYVDGYMEAACELAGAVIDKELWASRDTLAMPILYNARHALELSLKFAMYRLFRLGMVKTSSKLDHDILWHWVTLRDAKIGDAAIRQFIDELGPFVTSLANIDKDGQELRYAFNQEGKRSLDSKGVVNLPHIRHSLETQKKILSLLKDRVIELQFERATGSYTNECSRNDLKAIAGLLGRRETWTDPSFLDKKASVRTQFDLSSGKFSDAIDKIKQSRELSVLIGIETDLAHLTDEKAEHVLMKWLEVHPPPPLDAKPSSVDYFDRDWDQVQEYYRASRALDEAIVAELTEEEFADMQVLFYIGREREYGEHYEAMVTSTITENKRAGSRLQTVHHIASKTSLLENVIRGCEIVGRPSLGAKLRALQAQSLTKAPLSQ